MIKLNNKKIIFFTIGIFVLISLIIVLFQKKDEEIQKQTASVLKPTIPKPYFDSDFSFKINIKKEDFNFPSKLPLIVLEKKNLSMEQIKEIANKLEFQGEPYLINDTFEGISYYWKEENRFLSCYINSGVIRYVTNNQSRTENKSLDNDKIISLAENFFYNNSFTKTGSLNLNELKYLTIDNFSGTLVKTEKEKSLFYEVIFNPKSSDLEINTYWTDSPLIYVQITKEGLISSAQYINFNEIKKTETEYQIKDFNEFKDSLQESSLIALKIANVELSDIKEKIINEIKINNIKLIYLQDSSTSIYLQPVFKIIGTTSIKEYGDNIEVILYLPAISQK